MSKIFLITDPHFNHKNVIEYDGRDPDYQVKTLYHLHNLDMWMEDVLLCLGDVAFGDEFAAHQEILDAVHLNNPHAKCWLVLGNHDKRSIGWYLKCGWDFVGHAIDIDRGGYTIHFSHRPLPWEPDDGVINIHGHEHKSTMTARKIGLHNPDNNYQPYLLDSILKQHVKISRGKN